MPHVFISYVHENEIEVQRLCDELTNRGVKVWIDRNDIEPAVFWKDAIKKAIREGNFFIACFSAEYNARPQTYMNEELYLAIDMLRLKHYGQKWFIPVLLSPCEVPEIEIVALRTLRDIQWVELYKDWDDGVRRIIKVIRPEHIIGKDDAEMVLIPSGEFQMGSDNGNDDEKPVHTVYLDAFYIDVYLVTNAQYRRFVQAKGHLEPKGSAYLDGHIVPNFEPWKDSRFNGDDQPVVCVSWYDAMAYAEWSGKRLPTEAEWEKAARGGLVGKRYPWGDEEPDEKMASYGGNVKKTTPVGVYPPNSYGLYDMPGNVWEWCLDEYQKDFYKMSPRNNPLAGGNSSELLTDYRNIETLRVLRGGSWYIDPVNLCVAFRYRKDPDNWFNGYGFRCTSPRFPQ